MNSIYNKSTKFVRLPIHILGKNSNFVVFGKKWLVAWLVGLFYGISTFGGY